MTDPNRPRGFRDPDDPRQPWEFSSDESRRDPYAHSSLERRTPAGTRAITALAWTAAGAVAVGSVVLGFGPLAGIAALWGGTEARTTEIAEPFTSVDLVAQGIPVTVRYDDVPTATVVETSLPPGMMDLKVENGRLTVEHDAQGTMWRLFSREGLTLVLPEGSTSDPPDISIRVTTGSVDVQGRYDMVTVRAQTGSIDATGSFATLDATTGTGSVDLRGTVDAVRAETQTGSVDIRVEGSTQPREVNARTGTGSVDIRVPTGRYDVEATTGTGSTDVGVEDDNTSPHKITARTATGSIDIED